MRHGISHDFADHSIEAKALWFRELSMEERLALACEMGELAVSQHPDMPERRHAPTVRPGARVLRGEDVRLLRLEPEGPQPARAARAAGPAGGKTISAKKDVASGGAGVYATGVWSVGRDAGASLVWRFLPEGPA